MSLFRAGGFLATRGLGGSHTHLIVRGFLEVIQQEIAKRGRSYNKEYIRKYDEVKKEYYDEYNIYVELSAINGKDLFDPIINKIKYKVKDNDVNIVATPKKLSIQSPDIKINVKIVEK